MAWLHEYHFEHFSPLCWPWGILCKMYLVRCSPLFLISLWVTGEWPHSLMGDVKLFWHRPQDSHHTLRVTVWILWKDDILSFNTLGFTVWCVQNSKCELSLHTLLFPGAKFKNVVSIVHCSSQFSLNLMIIFNNRMYKRSLSLLRAKDKLSANSYFEAWWMHWFLGKI